MDRVTVYPSAIPLETDILRSNRFALIGLAKVCAALFGTSTIANGLACSPNSPADLTVKIAPGELYSLQTLDGTAYSSLAADTTHSIVKQGISLDTTTLSCPAPATSGYSVNYLIQATYQDVDSDATVLPFYNAANPTQAYSGPNNSGASSYTTRKGSVVISAKAGVAATTGAQTTPAADTGYTGLYVVTVAYGQTQITAANVATVTGAPFVPSLGLIAGGLQGNACNIATAGGSADAITASFMPGISALSNGMTLYVRAANTNATTTPTFTPAAGTIGAKTIVKGAGIALVAGDISGAGHWIELQYDATLDKWVLLNPASGLGVTPPQFDSSTKVATTAFVQRALGNYSGVIQAVGAMTLTASQVGSYVVCGGTYPYSITLPKPSDVPGGVFTFDVWITSSSPVTLSTPSGSFSNGGGNGSTFAIYGSTTVSVVSNGSNWAVQGGSGNALKAISGYQKQPSGLIMQWGLFTPSASGSTLTYPIAFPTTCAMFVGTVSSVLNQSMTVVTQMLYQATKIDVQVMNSTNGAGIALPVSWIAIGY